MHNSLAAASTSIDLPRWQGRDRMKLGCKVAESPRATAAMILLWSRIRLSGNKNDRPRYIVVL